MSTPPVPLGSISSDICLCVDVQLLGTPITSTSAMMSQPSLVDPPVTNRYSPAPTHCVEYEPPSLTEVIDPQCVDSRQLFW